MQIEELRGQIRNGSFRENTSGLMPNLVQGNLVIMPQAWADEFIQYCRANTRPCPLIGVSEAGHPALPDLGNDIDIRFDVPEYHLFREGVFSESCTDIQSYWQDDSVAIVLGCSFSFEQALISSGLPVRNITMGLNVSMYRTNIATTPSPHFACDMVVSMRPYKSKDIDAVRQITGEFPKAHGAPIHVGDPEQIGIKDIRFPEYGDAVPLEDDDIPVFWACGVTTQAAIAGAKLPLVISHAPGKMLITDRTYEQLL